MSQCIAMAAVGPTTFGVFQQVPLPPSLPPSLLISNVFARRGAAVHLFFQQLDCDPLTLIPSRTFPRMRANALITAFPCIALRGNARSSTVQLLQCTACSCDAAAVQSHNALGGAVQLKPFHSARL